MNDYREIGWRGGVGLANEPATIRVSRRQGYPLPVLPDDIAWFWAMVCQAALTAEMADRDEWEHGPMERFRIVQERHLHAVQRATPQGVV